MSRYHNQYHVLTFTFLANLLQAQGHKQWELTNLHTSGSGKYDCGETADPDLDLGLDGLKDQYSYGIELASPTTFTVKWNDDFFQGMRSFHPLKCNVSRCPDDPDCPGLKSGSLLLLENACWLKNTDDVSACFRQEYFTFPVPPAADTAKHELFVRDDLTGFEAAEGSKIQISARPDSEFMSTIFDNSLNPVSVEVCSHVGACVPNKGLCQPAFSLVAKNYAWEPYINSWADMPSTIFHPYMPDSGWVAYDWNQIHHIPNHGPYPHCPNDEMGRAMNCQGNETLAIHVTKIKVVSATIGLSGFQLDTKYTLQWGDRYAVHPCTINLWNVRTNGHALTTPGAGYWSPELDAPDAIQAAKTSASSSNGVLTGIGQPVEESVDYGGAWPQQLFLSRSFQSSIFPPPEMDWTKYPYDSQTLTAYIEASGIEDDGYKFVLGTDAFQKGKKVSVGSDWIFKSVTVNVVEEEDEPSVLEIKLTVTRNAKGKLFTLLMPIIGFAIADTMGHLLLPYKDTAPVFMGQVLLIGVAVNMINPSFLGFPAALPNMPFIQAIVLCLIIGTLKTAVLIMARLAMTRRVSDAKEKENANLSKFERHLEIYDVVVKLQVPIWYILSPIVVMIVYDMF